MLMNKSSLKISICTILLLIAMMATEIWAGTAQYTYDSLNRLTQVQYDDGTVIQYSYDAAGNRLVQQVTAAAQAKKQTPATGQTSGSSATIPLIQNSQTPTHRAP